MDNRLELIYIKSYKLKKLDNNPRIQIDDGATGKLRALIREHGFQNPLQVWKEGGKYTVLCGNHRYEAGMLEGMREFPCIKYKGTKQEAIARAISDNKSNEWTDWAGDELALLLRELETADFSLPDLTGFDQGEIDALLSDLEPEGLTDADEVPALPEGDPVTKEGDLWTLGGHRLICGDATDKNTVDRLMAGKKAQMVFTDPPYGIEIVNVQETDKGKIGYGDGHLGFVGAGGIVDANAYKPIKGDDTTETARLFYELCYKMNLKMIIWGGNYFSDFLPPSSCWICWDKRVEIPSNNFADCELAWTNITSPARMYRHIWSGLLREGNRTDELVKRVHPTQKPVGLAVWCLENYTNKGDVILDGFGGSGQTLIACEKINRACRMIEYESHYCDVILKRWADFTGEDPVREDGTKWSELYGKAA
jgi:DNA modification methylase